jgi:predicted O-methyltransferase YrrM
MIKIDKFLVDKNGIDYLGFMRRKSGLDNYLSRRGYSLSPVHSMKNEGYTSATQRRAFASELKKHAHIKRIAEIGFNAGHTSELFLESCPYAELVSFDLNSHHYTSAGVEYISSKFQDRFTFIQGDSRDTVPAFVQSNMKEKFDLIFIDGGHSLEVCFQDIQNCGCLASQNALLWVDDYNSEGVFLAVDIWQEQGLIKIIKPKSVSDSSGLRFWVEAYYVFEN